MFEKLSIKQIFRTIKSHALANVFIFILELVLIQAAHANKIANYIFSILALLIYFIAVYSDAYDIAKNDKKSSTKEEAFLSKGFCLPIGVSVLTVVLYVIYYLVWQGYQKTYCGFLFNVIFRIWISGFRGFVGLDGANMQWYGYIIVILMPVIISGVGYIAGLKDFDIQSKLSKYIYEKKEEKNEE